MVISAVEKKQSRGEEWEVVEKEMAVIENKVVWQALLRDEISVEPWRRWEGKLRGGLGGKHPGSGKAGAKAVGACLAWLRNSRKFRVAREVNDEKNI